MLSNIKWFLHKNDADKLFSLYESDSKLRIYIIDRLMQMHEIEQLLEIARYDKLYRADIILQLLEKNELELYHLESILRWLPFSRLYEKMIDMMEKQFTKGEIQRLKEKFKIKHLHNRSKMKVLEKLEINPNELIDDDYRTIKNIVKGLKIERTFEAENAETPKTIFQKFLEYQFKNKEKKNSFAVTKDFLASFLNDNNLNDELLLSIFNLSHLSSEEKVKMLIELKDSRLYYPEYFELITEFSQISMQNIRNFFSMTIVLDWVSKYLKSHWLQDLYTFMKNNPQVSWINEEIKRFDSYEDIAKISAKNQLFRDTAYSLVDIIPEKSIVEKLQKSANQLIKKIANDISNNDSPFAKEIKQILLIGGNPVFKFLNYLFQKQIVRDIDSKIEEISKKYEEKKFATDDTDELAEIISDEIIEKNKFISRAKYRELVVLYLDHFVHKTWIHPQLAKNVISNLPRLDKIYDFMKLQIDKINVIKFIAILKIKKYEKLLKKIVAEEVDEYLVFQAALALINLESIDAMSNFIKIYHDFKGNNKALLAKNLYYLNNINKALLVELASANESEICIPALRKITEMPEHKALEYIYDIIIGANFDSATEIIRVLKTLKSEQSIPLVIELTKQGGFYKKLELVRTLGNIDSQLSIKILKKMKFRNQFIIEIERARALIRLGQSDGWDVISAFMRFNVEYVQRYAQIVFLKHCNSSHLNTVSQLVKEKNPLVSIYALSKLSLYREEETWKIVKSIIYSDKNELKFYLSIFFTYFPIEKSREYIKNLYERGDYAAKTVCAILMLRDKDDSYLDEINKSVMDLSYKDHNDIIRAAEEYPRLEVLPILEKILLLQNHSHMKRILDVFLILDKQDLILLIFQMWKIGISETQEIIAEIVPALDDERVLNFIHKNITTCSESVKAKLSYALIKQGQDQGWDYLQGMLNNSEDFNAQKVAIKKIADIGSAKAIDLLTHHIKSPDDSVRAEIVKSLGKINSKEVFFIIKKYANDASAKVRISVAKSLGNMFFPDAIALLKTMIEDEEGYVKVAAEVSMEKIANGFTPKYNLKENMEEILKFNNWKLNIRLQKSMVKGFIKTYKKKNFVSLNNFASKVIMDPEDKISKMESLKEDLTQKLTGTSDIDQIMKAKEEFKTEVAKYVTIGDLLNSILNFDIDKESDENVNELIQVVYSNNMMVIKALIISSIKSQSKKWADILDAIINEYDINDELIDLLIFSIIRRFSPKSLIMLCKLFNFERAKYYFIVISNYYFLHHKSISKESIEQAINALQNSDTTSSNKETAENILKKLLLKKTEEEDI